MGPMCVENLDKTEYFPGGWIFMQSIKLRINLFG